MGGLKTGAEYEVQIFAYNAFGNSTVSLPLLVTPTGSEPSYEPTNFIPLVLSATEVTLQWDRHSEAVSYTIEQNVSGVRGPEYVTMASRILNTSHTIYNLNE